ncbi:hypothetical protein BCR33DRAFT_782272 [Rhizoclosmatium globosum]|uniref:Uncharacterized protein n=1 Tax=Rhizoclosmatium globosum TaxID=329046 RepID=A0A1Y2CNF4_9FUNG|nr:hypothetical protein BCR33DRAFT_782272 [Rhizoclosmatium globosum]|eukprot:ORY48561.1 hypothetical protein BCR33DRAFT_782272 [Rhizoclosmatium globosum]
MSTKAAPATAASAAQQRKARRAPRRHSTAATATYATKAASTNPSGRTRSSTGPPPVSAGLNGNVPYWSADDKVLERWSKMTLEEQNGAFLRSRFLPFYLESWTRDAEPLPAQASIPPTLSRPPPPANHQPITATFNNGYPYRYRRISPCISVA